MNLCDHGPPRKVGGTKCDGAKKHTLEYTSKYRSIYKSRISTKLYTREYLCFICRMRSSLRSRSFVDFLFSLQYCFVDTFCVFLFGVFFRLRLHVVSRDTELCYKPRRRQENCMIAENRRRFFFFYSFFPFLLFYKLFCLCFFIFDCVFARLVFCLRVHPTAWSSASALQTENTA